MRVGLSQPQVSRHVAGLERALGVTLVLRSPRRVELTDAGHQLLGDAREALASAERLTRRARTAGRDGSGTVAVGFIWSTLNGYLAPLVAAAAEHHPQIELAVTQLRFVDHDHALRRGEVDLAITRAFASAPGFVVTELNREPSVVAVPAGHRLAGRASVAVEELDGEPLIALARETIPEAYEAEAGRLAAAVRPSRLHHASSPSEALARVAAGLGIYYRMAASAAVAQPGVAYPELERSPIRTLLARRAEPPTAALAAIERLARERFGDAYHVSNDAPRTVVSGSPSP